MMLKPRLPGLHLATRLAVIMSYISMNQEVMLLPSGACVRVRACA